MSTEKEKLFHQFHHNRQLLILPNVWDPLSAALLEKVGYPAVATSSSALSLSHGYPDGQKLPFKDLLNILKRIVGSVKIPVTADVERAYAENNSTLREHIKKLTDTGIVGINFEDSKHGEAGMFPINEQCKKIELIKKTALESGSHLFINARIDVYIKGGSLKDEEKLADALERGKAYKAAGADGLYPIILKDKRHIEAIVNETGLPVNITMVPGIPDFKALNEIGVERVSLASGFLKNAVWTMKNTAEKLLKGEGMEETIHNMVSSEYMNSLI